MTGRMYLLPTRAPLPKHAAIILNLGRDQFVFEDTRYFGRFTLDTTPLARLGPEPLGEDFTPERFAKVLRTSGQPVKIRLLDQSVVVGVGNIYASEALFRAGISPSTKARSLTAQAVARLWQSIRKVLAEAIALGSTVPLDFPGRGKRDDLFYYGSAPGAPNFYDERLYVYDRQNMPCRRCGAPIRRIVQAGRSTFFCPRCQTRKRWPKRLKSV